MPHGRMDNIPLSVREQIEPGTIRVVTGYMEICDECGSPFRRMSTEGRAICGRCYPINVTSRHWTKSA